MSKEKYMLASTSVKGCCESYDIVISFETFLHSD